MKTTAQNRPLNQHANAPQNPTGGLVQLVRESERAQERVSWLERIELRCAAEWAAALVTSEGKPAKALATNEGEPPSDERDWRRAWIQVRALRFGMQTQFDYHLPKAPEAKSR